MTSAAELSILQDRIKRDSQGYKQEFLQQHSHFVTQYEIFQLKPSKDHKEFSSLVKFLSAVAPCYPDHLRDFPTQISDLLEKNALILHPDLRKNLVKALILLRNRNLLSPTSLLSLFFKLFRCPDKALRVLLRNHIIADITRENSKKKSVDLNRTLQNFMYTMLQEDSSSSIAPRESLAVLIELFRKNVWNDTKTVNVISLGVFSKDSKMIALTLKFFLNPPEKIKTGDEEEDEDKILSRKQVLLKYEKKMSKQTKAKRRLLSKKIKETDKKRKDKLRCEVDDLKQYNHAALTMINDPQGYAEKVFGALKKSNHSFDLKIGMMNLISRLITANKLMLHNFYSFLQKYTQPHQQNITQLLAILAQSIHPLVSPEVVEPIILHISNLFVTDRRPNEVIAIGLNTIREICLRSPLVMNETLLKDLVQYRHNKDKGVMMAARSLIGVFRAINPQLLPKKERGKDTDLEVKPYNFGEDATVTGIEGTEYLDKINNSGDESSWETVSNDGESDDSQRMVDDTEDENDGDEKDENEIKNENENEIEKKNEHKNENECTEDNKQDNENDNKDKNQKDIDQTHSEDEAENILEQEDIPELQPALPRLETMKILSEEEWAKIRYIQENKKELQQKGIIPTSKKRKVQHVVEDDVDEGNIVGWKKKRRMTKSDRAKANKEIQEERAQDKKRFGYGMRKKGASSTNIEKRKTKPYAMLRQKALTKQRRSANQRIRMKEKHIQKIASQKLDHH